MDGDVTLTGGNLEVNGVVFTNDLVVRRSSGSLITSPTVILPDLNITGNAVFDEVRLSLRRASAWC